MKKLFIIKIGGQVLDDETFKATFLDDFATVRGEKILVHGGGKIATRIGEKLGIEAKYVDGRRITDAATRDLVTMVYGGLVNKEIVAALQKRNVNALGLTGADGNVLKAVKRPVGKIDYGFVGDITADDVNTELIDLLLKNGIVPVFAPLTRTGEDMLNTNADTIASTLAVALSRQYDVRLIYCFEKKGVLMDVNDNSSVINHLTESTYLELKEKQVFADGILPKLENAYKSIHSGVNEVLIGDAKDLLKNTGTSTAGTLITQ